MIQRKDNNNQTSGIQNCEISSKVTGMWSGCYTLTACSVLSVLPGERISPFEKRHSGTLFPIKLKTMYEGEDAVVQRADAAQSHVAPPVLMAMDIVQKCAVAVSRLGAFPQTRNKRSCVSRILTQSERCLGLLGMIDVCCRPTLLALACFGTGYSHCQNEGWLARYVQRFCFCQIYLAVIHLMFGRCRRR